MVCILCLEVALTSTTDASLSLSLMVQAKLNIDEFTTDMQQNKGLKVNQSKSSLALTPTSTESIYLMSGTREGSNQHSQLQRQA